jgi:4-amino-4-deoxy-L-arabinose transferase-like glycosyltransferase
MTTRAGWAWAVALATLALIAATEPRLAIVWDEGYTLGREARLRLWFHALADPATFAASWRPPAEELVQQEGAPPPRPDQVDTRSKLLFDPQVLAWFWPFAREEPHGHPPFYAIVGLAGDVLTPWRPALERARLGPMLVFSLTAGALFSFFAGRWGTWAGAVAAGAWAFQPHLFGHGHYATYDALLASLWLGAVLAFDRAVEGDGGNSLRRPRWGWVVAFGLLLGAAADTKLTGWFLPLPFLAWVVLYRSRRGALTLLIGGLVGLVTLYAMNPPWWSEPVAGVVRFFASNLTRDETRRIKTLFLGRVISTPDGSLPWYNTLVWTAFVTPAGLLAMALVGLGRALRRCRAEPFGLLVAGHWAFLLALRALPHTPGHDGVRQFLPAFGLLAAMAGLGAASAVERLGRWGRWLCAAALAEAAVGVAVMMPVPLSYYSPLVGGLPGATALGMEPTYYWDALTDDARAWLRDHTGPGQKVRFATFPTSWLYLRDRGEIPPPLLPNDPGVWPWYVVQNRPGAFSPVDRALAARGRPAYVVRKLGVPLLWVFPYGEVESLLRPGTGNAHGPLAPGERAVEGDHARAASGSLAGRADLGRRLRRGDWRVGHRAIGVGRAGRHRGRAGRLLVAEGQLELGVPAAGRVLEQAALLDRRAGADRGRRRRGRRGRGRRLADHHGGHARRRRARRGTLLLVTRLRFARRQQDAQDAGQGQSQQLPSHEVISGTTRTSVKTHKMRCL